MEPERGHQRGQFVGIPEGAQAALWVSALPCFIHHFLSFNNHERAASAAAAAAARVMCVSVHMYQWNSEEENVLNRKISSKKKAHDGTACAYICESGAGGAVSATPEVK